MRRDYFILVVAHPTYGRIQRIHVPHYLIHAALSIFVLAGILGVGFVSSYARMLGKVSEFNRMRAEKAALQRVYEELERRVEERDLQLASLGSLASEVSIAFGIKREKPSDAVWSADDAEPTYEYSVNQFDLLQNLRLPGADGATMLALLENTTPAVWPVRGRISSSFGQRLDPFLGKGAFHPGIDFSSGGKADVVATADGRIASAGWSGGYGKQVVIDHGRNGLTTQYAHLSEIYVRAGQMVRRGEVIGRTGSTGRSTAAHLHYEVRLRGTRVNPYKYLRVQEPRSRPASLSLAD